MLLPKLTRWGVLCLYLYVSYCYTFQKALFLNSFDETLRHFSWSSNFLSYRDTFLWDNIHCWTAILTAVWKFKVKVWKYVLLILKLMTVPFHVMISEVLTEEKTYLLSSGNFSSTLKFKNILQHNVPIMHKRSFLIKWDP